LRAGAAGNGRAGHLEDILMVDRIFGLVLLAVALGYGALAFRLEAPFQYDPLGPGAWPEILAVALTVAAVALQFTPDENPDWGGAATLRRLALVFAGLVLYALSFVAAGFILSTTVFCAAVAWYLGVRPLRAVAFGALVGVPGYFICTRLLVLNLPSGPLPF
jgi:putative tricarboxylic transport membrane protein